MRILAFDQAFIRTGWAFGSDSGASHCGEIHIPAGRFDSLGSRLLKFERAVAELMDQHKPDLIAFEAHRGHSAVQAAQVLGAVSMSIMKMAEERKITYTGAEVGSIKAGFTGTGRASKALMIAVARKKNPTLAVKSDNVADALAIHEWARRNYGSKSR